MNKNLNIIITILYAVLTLICVINHEFSCDEIQVWQLAKYLNPLELINHLHNEGHPSFFYFLIMPFAKIFSDAIFLKLICWSASCLAVFLLLKYAPFKMYAKLAIILSAGFLYFFPVVARSYSILPLLVFLAAILYLKQKTHPILYAVVLLLIANTHVLMFGFVFSLFVLFIKDNFNLRQQKSFIMSVLIIFAGLCLVIFQLHDTTSSNNFISLRFDELLTNTLRVAHNFFMNSYFYQHEFDNPERTLFLFDIIAIGAIIANFVIIFINLYINSKRIFFITFFSIIFQFLIYIIAYPHYIYVNRIFCAYIIVIFGFWILICTNSINNKSKICSLKAINIMLFLMFILTLRSGFYHYFSDIKELNQSEQRTADFIFKNIDKNAILLTEHEPFCITLAYFLKGQYKLYSTIREEELKYVKWDDKSIQLLNNDDWLFGAIYYKQKYPQNDIYVIIPPDIEYKTELHNKYFSMVYTDKKFTIYKLND